jgi:cytochrome b6-f complex iron-sulfur subunit
MFISKFQKYQSRKMKITRKDFFKKSLQGATILAIPAALSPILESCTNDIMGPENSNPLSAIQGNLANGKVTITIDSSSPLVNVDSAAIVNYSSGSVLVNHSSENTFNALSSICTHQSCTVANFDSGSSQYVCPCHGSRYNFNGQVTQGPAGSPLRSFPTQFSGNQLIITIS